MSNNNIQKKFYQTKKFTLLINVSIVLLLFVLIPLLGSLGSLADVLCFLSGNIVIYTVASAISSSALMLAALIALFFSLRGGVLWFTAHGNKTKVKEAQKRILGAIIGLVIIFLAYFLLTVALGFFGVCLQGSSLPRRL